jgi:hypothetical protein
MENGEIMPAYIDTGLMAKYTLPSPKRIETLEMSMLAEEADAIDRIIEKFRGKNRRPLDEKTRELHRQASSLWSKYYQIDSEVNKEYHKFWSTES